MANLCSANFRKLDPAKALEILMKINVERFGALLTVGAFDDRIEISLEENDQSFSTNIWISGKSRTKMEWKHHYDRLWWWTINTMMSRMLREMSRKIRIRDEGISEALEPTFDLDYPSPIDWFKTYGPDIKLLNRVCVTADKKRYKKMVPAFFSAASK